MDFTYSDSSIIIATVSPTVSPVTKVGHRYVIRFRSPQFSLSLLFYRYSLFPERQTRQVSKSPVLAMTARYLVSILAL